METGEFTQATIALIEGSGDISDIIGNPFTSSEGIIANVIQSPIRFRMALTIFLLRLAALIRVVKDSNARSSSFWFQLLAVFLVIAFTPIFGILLYIAIRPQGWKWDKTPRRYTMFLNTQICENCGEFNQLNNSYCTSCGENLHISCRECSSKYSKSYSYCPNCGAPHLEE